MEGTETLILVRCISRLDDCLPMDAVVDAGVHGLEAAQHPGVCGVHDHAHRKAGDVPLPQGKKIGAGPHASIARPDRRYLLLRDETLFPVPLRQILVLYP